MQFDIHVAAWIVITAAACWLSEWRYNEVRRPRAEHAKRVEEEAARLEFNDEKTSEARKQQLSIRYPQLLIPPPSQFGQYIAKAEETVKENEKNEVSWKNLSGKDRFWFVSIVLIFVVLSCAFAFAGKLLITFTLGLFGH